MKKIGYLGPVGTFSEQALDEYIQRNHLTVEKVSAGSLFDLFFWLEDGQCDEIIVPIENSVEGSIVTTLDLLNQNSQIWIKEEVILKVEHSLIGTEETSISDVTSILSHSQALAQCHSFIHSNFPHVQTNPVPSTARAVQMISEFRDKNIAEAKKTVAIGNKRLAGIYQLKVLAQNIQDYSNNSTRFEVVSKEKTVSTGNDKTAFVFSTLKDKPGGLYEVLGEFATRQINLTKITSRPTKMVLGEYLFFMDFEGHVDDKVVIDVLNAVRTKTSYFKILGSFRKDNKPC